MTNEPDFEFTSSDEPQQVGLLLPAVQSAPESPRDPQEETDEFVFVDRTGDDPDAGSAIGLGASDIAGEATDRGYEGQVSGDDVLQFADDGRDAGDDEDTEIILMVISNQDFWG